MNGQYTRPALNQDVAIGALYDARTDSFLLHSFLNDELPPGVITLQKSDEVDIQARYGNSYVTRLDALHVGPDLSASILSGLVNPEGLGQHIVDQTPADQSLHAFIYHTIVTVRENLELSNHDLKSCIRSAALHTSTATHVVVGIDYGAQSVVTVHRHLRHEQTKEQGESQLQQMVDNLVMTMKSAGSNMTSILSEEFSRITAHSTAVGPDGIVLNDAEEARKFLQIVPLQMQQTRGGRGRPVLYRMLPVQMLSLFHLANVDNDRIPTMPSQDCMKKFVQLCDDFQAGQRALQSYDDFVSANRLRLPETHARDVKQRLRDIEFAEQQFRTDFGQKLRDVRAGLMDSERLWQTINETAHVSRSPKALSTMPDDYRWKLDFINEMTQAGATYFGYNGLDIRSQLAKRQGGESFVLYFSEMACQDQESWTVNQAMLLSLLDDHKPHDFFFAIVDCDATGQALEKSVISQYDGSVEIVHDLQEEQQYLAGHCFARRHTNALETENVPKPLKRRFVNIPCPGQLCSGGPCDWRCATCHASLEYGYTDQYIYCDCGRSVYNTFEFKCNDLNHGLGFEHYDDARLLAFLQSLDQSNCLNILILGETGVGKSTFINAFVNYLYFNTLDDALANDELHWVIPCSFAIQTMDRSRADNSIGERRIEVGSREDERDGSKGKSATQKTQVYPITIEGKLYRLIDTPGIGDTRGLEFDKSNMEDILRTVSGYDHLHGILLLLKPNNARLTAQFSFCVKELLTHLHRDATNNVVFGFTNTRVSHYTPGDTLGPLKTLLEERKDIGLTLTTQTTYCFDSESFRYLAAAKQGVTLDNKPDFDSSWSKSRSEAELMLKYFRTRDPHPIKSTISLNATRNLILELVKPMTEITKLIRDNIELQQDDVKLLEDHRLTGDKLKAKLHPEKQLLKKKDTSMPRTVCSDPSCTEFVDDGTGNSTTFIDYPNPCHPVCYLDNVTADTRAHPNLIGCAAFSGNEDCQQCGHHWTLHLHILYELESYREKVLDHGIQKLIQEHASDTVKKNEAIKQRKLLIAEYEKEHDEIQQTAANFGVWMGANSILPYNDATAAYLEVLIKAEQSKVDAGGINNKKVLADLQRDLDKHEELVRVLDESMKNSGGANLLTQDDIQQMIQRLYNLKHFGGNLESLQILNQEEHERTNRENPHRIKTKHQSRHRVVSKTYSVSRHGHGHSSPTSHRFPVRTASVRTGMRRNPSVLTNRMPGSFMDMGSGSQHSHLPLTYQQQQRMMRRPPSPKRQSTGFFGKLFKT